MKLSDIEKLCHGVLLNSSKDTICNNFSIDTRTINKDDIYIGIKGDVFDGNTFYKDAIKKGAKACILDCNKEDIELINNIPILLVEDTIKAIQQIAKYKRETHNIPVIAITGSVGKTSVKDMISKVLSSKYNVLATKGNLNNHIGLPLTMLNLNSQDILVVEMGMSNFGEIHTLTNIAKPTIAIITNIGSAHIGLLGSRENILKAKMEILDGMTDGYLIINNDNDLLKTIKYPRLITIGIDNDSDYMAKEINTLAFSSNFYIDNLYIELPIGSKAFIYNTLFAYAVAKKLGIEDKLIIKSLKELTINPHRLEVIKKEKYTIIDDTYNASFDSVKNALDSLSKVNGRKVFIFGDMYELEGFAKEIHQNVGLLCMEYKIDLILTIGTLSKHSNDIIDEEKVKAYHFNTLDELLQNINKYIFMGDTILVKGSHAMNLDKVVDFLKNNEF